VSTKKRPSTTSRPAAGNTAATSSPDSPATLSAAITELWQVIDSGDILRAEIQVAGMLALPGLNGADRAESERYVKTLISTASYRSPRSHAAAFYRLLMSTGSATVKKAASGALRETTSLGAYPPGWVTEIGKPTPIKAWRRHDAFGDEEAVVVTFGYGDKQHGLLVRIDRVVMPVAATVAISPEPDRLVAAVGNVSDNPGDQFGEISLAQARALVEGPLTRAAQSGRGLTAASATFLPVARAHIRRLPAEGADPVATFTAADRAAAVEEFLASPLAAQAGDPEVARFWAQALTGYSGRTDDEAPAQVGPRKIVAMLGHVASTFELTDAQFDGLAAAGGAWITWAAGHQKLDQAATDEVLATLPKSLGEFSRAYDDPQSALARAYVGDLSGAAADTDVRDLAAAVTRRSVAIPLPGSRDAVPAATDVTAPAARAAAVEREFGTCTLDAGQTREDLIASATRVVEELWSGEPASTWEAARSLLGEGRNRHDAIHALVLQAVLPRFSAKNAVSFSTAGPTYRSLS
jgi:hypothetical protein